MNLWKDLSFLCAILLNVIIIISYGNGPEGSDTDQQRLDSPSLANSLDVESTKRIFDVVGICMSCFSVFVVIFYIFKKAPLVIKNSWKDEEDESGKAASKKKKSFIMRIITFIIKLIKTTYNLLSNFQLLYYIAYGATALVGALVHEFFFTFHMTEILVR